MSRVTNSLRNIVLQNEKFNIFTSIRTSLDEIPKEQQNPSSPLLNKTVGIKDNIATVNEPTSCSSQILADYQSPFDATVVSLLNRAGVITVGKTNMDEFGMGSGTIHSKFGPTINPLFHDSNTQHICGGSSGGSAAAVSADLVDFALGTDTGGSVRLPAAYTGILGFKPSYGRISRWGVVAYAQSLDTVGILTKDIKLLENVFETLDVYDERDPTSLSVEIREKIYDTTKARSNDKLRIGIVKELGAMNLSTEVQASWSQVLDKLHEYTEIVPVSLPTLKYALPVYYTIAPAEAASNLVRYDGIRYGYRSDDDKNQYAKTRGGFSKEVQTRIMLGNYNLNTDSYQNHFLKAQNLRNTMREQFDDVFKFQNHISGNKLAENGVDILISPVSMTTAPTIESFQNQTPTEAYVNDTFTVPASLAGLPAISAPWGAGENTVGIQLMGQYGDDSKVLEAAKILQELA